MADGRVIATRKFEWLYHIALFSAKGEYCLRLGYCGGCAFSSVHNRKSKKEKQDRSSHQHHFVYRTWAEWISTKDYTMDNTENYCYFGHFGSFRLPTITICPIDIGSPCRQNANAERFNSAVGFEFHSSIKWMFHSNSPIARNPLWLFKLCRSSLFFICQDVSWITFLGNISPPGWRIYRWKWDRRVDWAPKVRKSRGSKLCFRLSLYVFFLAWEMSKIQCLDFLLARYRRPNPERSRLLPSHERDRRALLIRDASRRGHVIRGSSRPGCESSRHTLET